MLIILYTGGVVMTFEELNAKHGVTVVPHPKNRLQVLVGYFSTTEAAENYIAEARLIPTCVFYPFSDPVSQVGTNIGVWLQLNRTA